MHVIGNSLVMESSFFWEYCGQLVLVRKHIEAEQKLTIAGTGTLNYV